VLQLEAVKYERSVRQILGQFSSLHNVAIVLLLPQLSRKPCARIQSVGGEVPQCDAWQAAASQAAADVLVH
jgi:hypothetical protein